MRDRLTKEIHDITDGRLSSKEIQHIVDFLRQLKAHQTEFDEVRFFKDLAYEMKGQVKELASLIIDCRKELKSKIHPELTDIAVKYIPEAADQLETIIESTEMAANKIMDNLEGMQGNGEALKKAVDSLRRGTVHVKEGQRGKVDLVLDSQTNRDISLFIDSVEPHIDNITSLISDSFIQMSFQDLTGQRIKRIIALVNQIEERIANMVISFGIKLTERERNPQISSGELQRAVEEKVTELAGPQREGKGLDQAGIDELLANL
jgi:chemotaxis protein CheZ